MKISRSSSLMLTPFAVAASMAIAQPSWAQKGPHTGMGRPGLARPAKPEKPAAQAKAAERNPAAHQLIVQGQIEKLATMTPEQRQNALSLLPPAQRKHLEDGLAKWQELTPEQRQNAKARLEKMQALPPEEQTQVRMAAQAFQQLPDDRKRSINQEMKKLRSMTPQQRDARMATPDFKSKFSPAEQDIVKRRLEVAPELPANPATAQ